MKIQRRPRAKEQKTISSPGTNGLSLGAIGRGGQMKINNKSRLSPTPPIAWPGFGAWAPLKGVWPPPESELAGILLGQP